MIPVVIADDSAFMRQVLKKILEQSGRIKVVAAVKNGKEAIEAIAQLNPALAIFDVEMPVMNGLEALRVLMREHPLPVLMFSSLTADGTAVTIKALQYGAADFLLKPTSLSGDLSLMTKDLVEKVEMLALRKQRLGAPSANNLGMPYIAPQAGVEIIAMGSSTGGVQAALEVLKDLPEAMPPLVWVQHMPATFTKKLADRFDSLCHLHVQEVQEGDILKSGVCYLAPGGVQMRVNKKGDQMVLHLGESDKVSGFCPSCDVLFTSVAALTKKSVGIILTGMGNDGTEGLVHMKNAGAYILGQDKTSSVVYGMPRAAFEAGVVDCQLSIEYMGKALMRACALGQG